MRFSSYALAVLAILLVVSVNLQLAIPSASARVWEDRGIVDDNVGRWGRYSADMEIDSQGRPHISYFAAEAVKYATRDAEGIWRIETVSPSDDVIAGYVGQTSIALVPGTETPVITYFDNAYEIWRPDGTLDFEWYQLLMVAYGPSPWGSFIGWPGQPYWEASLEIIGPSSPLNPVLPDERIVMYDSVYDDLRVLSPLPPPLGPPGPYYVSITGSIVFLPYMPVTIDSAGNVGKCLDTAKDSSGAVHISYYDRTNTALKYALVPSALVGWFVETVDPNVRREGEREIYLIERFSSIAVGPDGVPQIIYIGAEGLQYARRNADGSWSVEVVDPAADYARMSIAVDQYGAPHICYSVEGGLKLNYATKTPVDWSIETVEVLQSPSRDVEVGSVMDPVIGVDSGRNVYIIYYDLVNRDLRYVRGEPLASEASVESATGAGSVTFATNAGGFSSLSAVSEDSLPTAGKPPGVTFPFGFFSWTIDDIPLGATVTVNMVFPSNVPSPAQYWKVIGNTWTDVSSLLGDDDGDNFLTLTITDGGLGDADGSVNGQISDPGGVAVAVTPPTGVPEFEAPTMLLVTVGLLALWALRRKPIRPTKT